MFRLVSLVARALMILIFWREGLSDMSTHHMERLAVILQCECLVYLFFV